MPETAESLDLEHVCIGLVGVAIQARRVPVCWMLGPGSDKLIWDEKYPMPSTLHDAIMKGTLPPFMGLPCLRMQAQGIALRTVAEQESGFD
jgi:hypothetical protein